MLLAREGIGRVVTSPLLRARQTGDETTLRPKIAAYLEREVGHPVEVGPIRRFAVSVSRIEIPGEGACRRALILRLGLDYGLVAPYSAMPEMLAMRSLEGSAVPVPRAYWAGDDKSVFGAPFLFCEKVDGEAVVPWSRRASRSSRRATASVSPSSSSTPSEPCTGCRGEQAGYPVDMESVRCYWLS